MQARRPAGVDKVRIDWSKKKDVQWNWDAHVSEVQSQFKDATQVDVKYASPEWEMDGSDYTAVDGLKKDHRGCTRLQSKRGGKNK